MDSFELNKIIGAILGTCIFVLVTSFAANAIFSPVKPEKPGFEIAGKACFRRCHIEPGPRRGR